VIRPGLDEVYRARQRASPFVRRTPLVPSPWLTGACGADVHLKLESLQVTHSFKIRGALNAIASVTASAGPDAAVVTASAGNHGVALAYAAKVARVPVTIFTPASAPATKLEAIARHGATLHAVAADYDDAERMALAFSAEHGATYVSAYNHPDVIAGAGTVGLEVIEQLPDVDMILVPVGGGGLLSGVALAAKGVRPGVRMIGVEAANNPVLARSLAAGMITHVDVLPTIADGLSGNLEPGSITFEMVRDLVDDMVAVSEDELRAAIRGLAAHEHVIAEGAGVPAVAALMSGRVDLTGRRTVAVVSGANIDVALLANVLGETPCGQERGSG
jgi:threonine dehydratase